MVQVVNAAKQFLNKDIDEINSDSIYERNPDKRLDWFDIRVVGNSFPEFFINARTSEAKQLNEVKRKIIENNITKRQQEKLELAAQRKFFLQDKIYKIKYLFQNINEIEKFFKNVKCFVINSFFS